MKVGQKGVGTVDVEQSTDTLERLRATQIRTIGDRPRLIRATCPLIRTQQWKAPRVRSSKASFASKLARRP